jgi:glucosamine 6-phosphate synthetase-like amidotransferase/phosphosugar isomerase protein
LPAEVFVETEEYQDVMAELPVRLGRDNKVTIIMGHTRYRTIGTEKRSNNNHPIRAGRIIGTHNGTIYNTAHIAKMYGLNRFTDVDSEVLFRVANKFRNPIQFKSKLKSFRGQMTAVMVNLNSPELIRIYKGNKPFAMMWLNELDSMIYTSNGEYFESVKTDGYTKHDYRFKPNRTIQINTEKELKMKVSNFKFKAEVRKKCKGYSFTEH